MAIAPRKPKELMKLMLQDADLKREMHDIVARADKLIEKDSLTALREFLARQQVDLRLLDHDQVSEALTRFYREARMMGQFVKMW